VDRITVPDDLHDLSDAELTDLGLQIREAAEALADDAANDDEALAEIEKLVAEFDRVNNELAAREEKASARRERAEQILSHLDSGSEPVIEDITVDEADAEAASIEADADDTAEAEVGDTAEVEVVEAAVEDTDIEAEVIEVAVEAAIESEVAEDASIIDESDAEAPAEATITEAAIEVAEEVNTVPATLAVDQEVEIVEDTPTTAIARSTRPTVAALRKSRPAAAEPREESEVQRTGAAFLASTAIPGLHEGTELDNARLAEKIASKAHGLNSASAGGYERIVMATAKSDHPFKVTGSAEENFATIEAVKAAHRSRTSQEQALVASGGVCAPLEPSYDFFRLAEELNPVEDCLPVVEAARGGIRFITPPDFRDAAGGVRVTTEAEDAAGYPPTAPKPCVAVVCPPVEECRVDAVSQCVQFGNLNFRVFPEQVEAFLADLSVIFTETKEIFYLDAIDGLSTAVTSTPAYGAVRGIVQDLAAAAAGYRRRNHMAPDAILQVLLPSWVIEFIKVDMVNDHSLGLGFLGADTMAVAAEMLASLYLDPCFYYDSATGAGQAFNGAQGAGPLNPFPTTVVSYIFAPGTFVRLDGGTLDVGLIRDSTLNGTNDLQIFSEQWVQVCRVGLESIRLESTLCPDGTAPEPVIPLVC